VSEVALAAPRPSVAARILMLPIRAWRLVSVHLPPRCRFHPSCSQYALEAITLHGAGRGSWLAIRRVGRCHPWHDGGLDPVPPATPSSANVRSTLAAPVGVAEEG
jgi:putative membrane protein insertion efficiency factor